MKVSGDEGPHIISNVPVDVGGGRGKEITGNV